MSLDLFPDGATAYEMRFFHAELRYALADFEGAGEEYDRVTALDIKAAQAKPAPGEQAPKPGKFFKDALENSVFAWDLVAMLRGQAGHITGQVLVVDGGLALE